MTLHSTIKIAGATPERAADGSAVSAEGDLFTQLLSTLVAAPSAEPGAAAPAELLLLQPEAVASNDEAEDVPMTPASSEEDEADPEDQVLALAGLFTLPQVERPVAAPATLAPAAEAPVTAPAPAVTSEPSPILADMAPPSDEQKADEAPADFQLPLQPAGAGDETFPVSDEESPSPDTVPVAAPAAAAKPITDQGRIAAALAQVVPTSRPPAKPGSPEKASPAVAPLMPRIDPQAFQPLVFDIASALSEAAPETVPAFEPAMPAEFAVEQQLDLSRDEQWLDQLAKDIVQTGGKDGQLRFRLNPETLGTLRVEISQGQAGASIRLSADTEAARTIIADAQPRLIAEAKAQGVRIAETHVDLGTGQGPADDPRRDAQGQENKEFIRTAGRADEPAETTELARKAAPSERYA